MTANRAAAKYLVARYLATTHPVPFICEPANRGPQKLYR